MLSRAAVALGALATFACTPKPPSTSLTGENNSPEISASALNPNTHVSQVIHVDIPYDAQDGKFGAETFFRCYYLVPPAEKKTMEDFIAHSPQKTLQDFFDRSPVAYDFRNAKLLNLDKLGYWEDLKDEVSSKNSSKLKVERFVQARKNTVGLVAGVVSSAIALTTPLFTIIGSGLAWRALREIQWRTEGKELTRDAWAGATFPVTLLPVNAVRLPQQAYLISHSINNPEANQGTAAVIGARKGGKIQRTPLTIKPVTEEAVQIYIKAIEEKGAELSRAGNRERQVTCPQAASLSFPTEESQF